MTANPLQLIAAAPMRTRQYIIVILCCVINLTEGYDLRSISYAAPVLAREWHIPAQMLGLVFSAGSVGLAISAFLLAPLADRFGRRLMIILALVAITLSHALSSIDQSVTELLVLRVLMGLGLGILVVNLNIVVSEYSSDRERNFLLSILHAGFTIGMAIAGGAAALVLVPFGWRAIFVVGTVINAILLLTLMVFPWESPTYLIAARPKNALAKLNRILSSLGHAELDEMPPPPRKSDAGIGALFVSDIRYATLLIWLVSLSQAIVGYFLINWQPTVLVSAGLTPTQAGLSGILESAFGLAGHLTMGAFSRRFGEGRLTALYFALMVVVLIAFGNLHAPPLVMILMASFLTFFTVGAYTGIFLNTIALYPPVARGYGMSFVVGWSRFGSIIGPSIGGLMLGAGMPRSDTFAVFASIAVIPVLCMLFLMRRDGLRTA